MNNIQRPTSAGLVGGVILIVLGLLFLVGNLVRVDVWGVAGPLFVIAIGVMFFVGMIVGGKPLGALAIPGSMFVILGLILSAQSIFDKYESWAYAWSLFAVTGVGIGLVIFSWWSDKPNLKRPGYTLIVMGLILFVVFGTFMETLFGAFGRGASGTLWFPLLLIGFGVLLLFKRFLNWGELIEQLPPHNEIKS